MRRPRSDSKLEALTEGQKQQLCEWLLTAGLPYRVITKMLLEEFGVDTSERALSHFYHSYCVPELLRRRAEAVKVTSEFGKEIERRPGMWDRATMDALKQKGFELAISPCAKPMELRQLYTLILKSRDQDLVERRVRVLEAAEEKLKEAEEASKGIVLSPEEKQQKLKEIFGLV